YIKKHASDVTEKYRLKYHLMPPVGWMNDPNGLVFYKGQYHVFYQFYPYDSVWGPMHWGHSVSNNLVLFHDCLVALAPDLEDESGCYSGGAIVDPNDPNRLYLYYTKHKEVDGVIEERQGIAWSDDGIHFNKKLVPIIDLDETAPHGMTTDTRDPLPIYRDGYYYLLLGSITPKRHGKILIYRSINAYDFEYHDEFTMDIFENAMAECPSISHYGNTDIFLFSTLYYDKVTKKNISYYVQGIFDFKEKKYLHSKPMLIDFGHHFYAPQTLVDDKDRIIMIAWMEMWESRKVTHDLGHNWNGAMTFPRELKIINDKLHQYPVEEIKNYRTKRLELLNEMRIQKSVDIEILDTAKDFSIHVCNSVNLVENFEINYRNGIISVSGENIKLLPLERVQCEDVIDHVCLRILIDTSSIEIFVNDGIAAFTSRIFMDCEEYTIQKSDSVIGLVYNLEIK
ncbi:MAG: glycoside hydrolase family 32 protein, partial [Nitrosarchaeum sp.]